MEPLALLQTIWYFIIGILLAGYAILDGFDLGIGALFHVLAKSDEDRKRLFDSIWPFWDGNEVWLITGGAALFAAFPLAYATVFSGFYLALMLVLFALIFRAVSIEFWHHDEGRRPLWSAAFTIGSLLPSLLYGVALGNVILGVPLDANFEFTGSFFTLLRPYPLALGILGLAAILLHGASYAALKTDGELGLRARKAVKGLWAVFIVALSLSFAATVIYLPKTLTSPYIWVSAALVLVAWALLRWFSASGRDGAAFIMSSASFAGLWGLAGATHFPNLVKSGTEAAANITIANASSSELTLRVMLIIALIGMPLVATYSIFVYKVFKGKIETGR